MSQAKAEKPRCQGWVMHGRWQQVQCGRRSCFEHDGKHFCATQYPQNIQAKQERKAAEFDARYKMRMQASAAAEQARAEQKRRADLFPEMLEALKRTTDALAGGLWDYGPGQDEHDKCELVINDCRAVVAKAEDA